MAEDHRRAILLRQPVQLLEEDWAGIPRVIIPGVRGPAIGGFDRGLAAPAPQGRGPGLDRDPPGHAVEPGRQRVGHSDRARLADQDQEGRLEGVVGVHRVPEHTPADPEDHRPVLRDDRLESRLGRVPAGRRTGRAAPRRSTRRPRPTPRSGQGHDDKPFDCSRSVIGLVLLALRPTYPRNAPGQGRPYRFFRPPSFSRPRRSCRNSGRGVFPHLRGSFTLPLTIADGGGDVGWHWWLAHQCSPGGWHGARAA